MNGVALKPCPHHEQAVFPKSYYVCIDDYADIWKADIVCHECLWSFSETGATPEEAMEKAAKGWNERYERTCHIKMVGQGEWECDQCGSSISWDSPYEDDPPNCNYCPNCGAKVMKE